MNYINWDFFKCRCSGINRMMANSKSNPVITEKQSVLLVEFEKKEKLTEAQSIEMARLIQLRENSKKVVLSDSCIELLMEMYSLETTGKVAVSKELDIDQMQKGKLVEEESITLLSVVDGVVYLKNDERVNNDFLSGEPDSFIGDNIMNASKIVDVKSCFDYPSFLKKINRVAENGWEDQVQGYCDITGATEGEIAHCLVDMPEIMINDFKKRLFFKMSVISEESPEFLEKWAVLERSMTFTEIPIHQRVFKIKIEPFTKERQQQVYDRVKICREWLCKFDEYYKNLNLPIE